MIKNITLTALLIESLLLLTVNVCMAQPLSREAEYVGAEECRQCHSEIYQGWKSTLHPYKFQPASPAAIVGDFSKNNSMDIDGRTTTMFEKNGKYFVTTTGPDGEQHTYEVKYVIGGFWKQLYVTEFPNGELHILPAMWIVKTQTWKKTKNWSKTIYQNACSGCHNTGTSINYDEKADTYRTTWSDLGVACEACHGPGSVHVEAEKEDKAATIVNPTKIPDFRRAVMVCGSCHTRGSCCEGKYGYPKGYQPGDLLNFTTVCSSGSSPMILRNPIFVLFFVSFIQLPVTVP